MEPTWSGWLTRSIDSLENSSLLRSLRPVQSVYSSPVEVYISDKTRSAWLNDVPSTGEVAMENNEVSSGFPDSGMHRIRLFSSNDYLGLSSHPRVVVAGVQAFKTQGMGPRSSPLVAGYTTHYRRLESGLASLKGTEECLLFPTGFAANTSVLACLGAPSPDSPVAVFSDELNHASIVDGLRLAKVKGATLYIYRHLDVGHLDSLLSSSQHLGPHCRRLVVTDGVFSMDGDRAPLAEICALKPKHSFLLVVDQAHATLLYEEEVTGVDVHVGTLSKAFGSLGGFVAAPRKVKQLLVTLGRPFVYSTALPAPVVAAALAALTVAQDTPDLRNSLWARVSQLGEALGRKLESPIVPLLVGNPQQALSLSKELLRKGFHVPAIRPPTVPPGSSRLRIAISAAHSEEDICDLIEALKSSGAVLAATKYGKENSVTFVKSAL